MTTRRSLLLAGAATLTCRPASATPDSLREAIQRLTGGAELHEGRVRLAISPLVENGNAVPVTLAVDGPLGPAESVRRLALFTERNPQPEVAVFELGPLAGRAEVATRVRLATSQSLVALAEFSDGTWWQQRGGRWWSRWPPASRVAELASVQAILNVPSSARAGEVVPVSALIQHPMETGYRVGPEGQPLPRELIRRVECRFDGETVFTADLHAAVAANPYLAFFLRVPHSGVVSVVWQGDGGFVHERRARIEVA